MSAQPLTEEVLQHINEQLEPVEEEYYPDEYYYSDEESDDFELEPVED